MRISHTPFLLCFLLMEGAQVNAQSQYLPSQYHQEIRLEINERAFSALALSYLREFPDALDEKGLYVRGGMEIPVLLDIASGEFNDFRLMAETGTRFRFGKRTGVGAAIRLFLDRQDMVLGLHTAVGFQLRTTPFIRIRHSLIGLDLAWSQVLSEYIKHSAYSADRFEERYPGNKGPIDGWYVAPGTQFLTGLAVGGIIRERVSLDMAVGLKLTPPRFAGFMDGMMFGQIPFYGRIGFGIFI